MSTNREISEAFRQIATALELLEANRFRVNGNLRVARPLRTLTRRSRAWWRRIRGRQFPSRALDDGSTRVPNSFE